MTAVLAENLSSSPQTVVAINNESDIVTARQEGRRLAAHRGFSSTEQTLIATAISELARNIVEYAKRGEIVLAAIEREGRRGVWIVARDQGPGISDIGLAMRDGWSTAKSLGMGLPGTRRLMDEFDLESAPGKGTSVSVKKWVR